MADTTTEVPRGDWAQVRSLADLGALTALWLEGRIWHQPGYADPDVTGLDIGPDPETRELVPVLAACNRAGFMTHASQPGETDDGYEQRAAVQGFARYVDCERLRALAGDAGLIFQAGPAPRFKSRFSAAVPVSAVNGRPCTRFGTLLSLRHLRDGWVGYGECRRSAVDALCNAWQVTIIDPEWGRNDRLWLVLERFAQEG